MYTRPMCVSSQFEYREVRSDLMHLNLVLTIVFNMIVLVTVLITQLIVSEACLLQTSFFVYKSSLPQQ